MQEPGDRIIYFLVESPHKGFGELYTRVTGPEAEYFELEDGQFVKMESWAGYQNSLSIEEKLQMKILRCMKLTHLIKLVS